MQCFEKIKEKIRKIASGASERVEKRIEECVKSVLETPK